jgi:hypothetical protein
MRVGDLQFWICLGFGFWDLEIRQPRIVFFNFSELGLALRYQIVEFLRLNVPPDTHHHS